MSGDLLVLGGTLVDGTGAPGRRADVRVRGGRISEVGERLDAAGETVVDATGAIVAPGFIDTHTHFDPSLFWDPMCDPMPQHGVTTVLMGNCSLSLAPVAPSFGDELRSVFCFIEDMPEQAVAEQVPWSWSTYEQYRDVLRQQGYGVNVASLVGHTPLRLFVMGDDAWDRPATAAERQQLAAVLDASLGAGAFGLSTSFFDEDARSRPVPSRLADDAEFEALFDVLAAHGRMLEFLPNFTTGMLSDIDRMAALAGPRGITATWNGTAHDETRPERCASVLERAAELQAGGVHFYPQVSPRSVDIRINWQGGMAFMRMPETWQPMVQAPTEEKRRRLRDPAWRAAARAEWDRVPRALFNHHRTDRVRLVEVTRPEHEKWLGASLADLIADRGGHPSDVLADWVLDNDCNPGVVAVGIVNDDAEGVAGTLRHPATIVSNSDAGAHLQMMCAAGDTTLLLARHVRDRGDLQLEEAVHALTGRQAELFGFAGRGVVAPGAAADLTVFALDELEWLEEVFVRDVPAGGRRMRRPAGGFRSTIVSGVVTQHDGELTGERPGGVLDAGRL